MDSKRQSTQPTISGPHALKELTRPVGQASLLVSPGAPDSARVSPSGYRLFTLLGRDAVRFAGSTSESGIGFAF